MQAPSKPVIKLFHLNRSGELVREMQWRLDGASPTILFTLSIRNYDFTHSLCRAKATRFLPPPESFIIV